MLFSIFWWPTTGLRIISNNSSWIIIYRDEISQTTWKSNIDQMSLHLIIIYEKIYWFSYVLATRLYDTLLKYYVLEKRLNPSWLLVGQLQI